MTCNVLGARKTGKGVTKSSFGVPRGEKNKIEGKKAKSQALWENCIRDFTLCVGRQDGGGRKEEGRGNRTKCWGGTYSSGGRGGTRKWGRKAQPKPNRSQIQKLIISCLSEKIGKVSGGWSA